VARDWGDVTLTRSTPLPALLCWIILSALPAPTCADPAGKPSPAPIRARSATARLDLFAPRVRRSTIAYLRLRLLELREEDLDRARAAIERRLGIDELLAAPPHRRGPG
jgi:hypothetical protein